jgi:hypothetical protein
MENTQMVRVVVFQDAGQLVAQCLEYDICAHAADEETLRHRFEAVLNFERNLSIERNGLPFAGIDPAPAEFQKMWDECPHVDNHEMSGEFVEFKMCA